jgi:integrase
LALVMSISGIRPGEAFALKHSDFSFADKTVSISRALSFESDIDIETKTSSNSKPLIKELKNERNGKKNPVARRILAVTDEVLDAVSSLWGSIHADAGQVAKRAEGGYQEYLFTSPRDGVLKRPDYYQQEYGKELRRKGVDSSEFNLYRFRHTFCTRMLRDHKVSPKIVATAMGDSSVDMVMRVYHSVNKDDVLGVSATYAA